MTPIVGRKRRFRKRGGLVPGAAQHFLVVRCGPGTVPDSSVGTFPGRSAACSVAECCTADPGSLRMPSLERSRISGAPLRIAREDGRKRLNELRAAPRPGKVQMIAR